MDVLRRKQYSYETQKAYISWYKRYVRFHEYVHPAEMGAGEIEVSLSDLAGKNLTAFGKGGKSRIVGLPEHSVADPEAALPMPSFFGSLKVGGHRSEALSHPSIHSFSQITNGKDSRRFPRFAVKRFWDPRQYPNVTTALSLVRES